MIFNKIFHTKTSLVNLKIKVIKEIILKHIFPFSKEVTKEINGKKNSFSKQKIYKNFILVNQNFQSLVQRTYNLHSCLSPEVV